MRRSTVSVFVLSVAIRASLVVAAQPATAGITDPPNGPSDTAAVSSDGRYVAFLSAASNLLGGDTALDTNGKTDVFVADTVTHTVRLVSSVPVTHAPADGDATEVDLSADGRYVAFVSEATNLLATDANGELSDVVVFDQQTGALALASRRGLAGAQGDGTSWNVSISSDGSKVAFTSSATNLVAGDTNHVTDAFVRDISTSTTTLVSRNSNGKLENGFTSNAGISGNGAWVAFASNASNLVNGDSNGKRDIFIQNLSTEKTTRVSLTNADKQANGASSFYDLSSNGRFVVFTSDATNLAGTDGNDVTDVFLRDRTDGTTTRVSKRGTTEANDDSYGAAISPDGAYVAFTTHATNLGGVLVDANGSEADVFEFEVATKTLRLVSKNAIGAWADGATFDPSYGSSSLMTFSSLATDLVLGDLDGVSDVFTRSWPSGREGGVTTLRSLPLVVA
jgi:Tol biopolymer transport system component